MLRPNMQEREREGVGGSEMGRSEMGRSGEGRSEEGE